MKKRIHEWLSIQIAKNPGRVVVFAILLFNLLFLLISAAIISNFALSGTEKMGFLKAAFYTVTMILDAGCIQFVVDEIGQANVAIAIVCLIIIIIGMISFTGAVIGYVTNYISDFIANSNAGKRKLSLYGHTVILNWNTRASEIINDLLYNPGKQKVVVLTDGHREEIKREIEERLSDTITRENLQLQESIKGLPLLTRVGLFRANRLRHNIIVIIREGDVFSSKQLHDIGVEYAQSVIILNKDMNNTECKYEMADPLDLKRKGNALTVKALMQVADITGADYSADNQRIIVEIADRWTWELVEKIIKHKQVDGKCNIVPVKINKILGQILSQFSLMPELNLAYNELFSNKGATFHVGTIGEMPDRVYINDYLKNHRHAIPLSAIEKDGTKYFFYSSESEKDVYRTSDVKKTEYSVKLNRNYWIEKKKVIILGHNDKSYDIMRGFKSFTNEWGLEDDEILQVIVIDDEDSLKHMNYYSEYPFVKKTVAASVYDKTLICETIESVVDENEEDTSILILSDESVTAENIDVNALANLIYVQGIIAERKEKDPDFDEESIDVIVEIIDPKHYDVVSSYSINNVVISNRYISKMITQIGEKDAIFDFFQDILTYDEADVDRYVSKEVYTKKVSLFFDELPEPCTAAQFIRAVWEDSIDPSLPEEKRYPTVALGYVKPGGKVTLFGGDQADQRVVLEERDKVIVYTNH